MFGQQSAIQVTSAIVNSAIDVATALEAQKLQDKFQQQQQQQATVADYISNIILKLQSSGNRIVQTGQALPGTVAFETILQQALLNDMAYQGNCTGGIYVPGTGYPRDIIGYFYPSGVVQGAAPAFTGPIWAAGCKNAQDSFQKNYLKIYKQTAQFNAQQNQTANLGALSLLLRFGLGIFLVSMLVAALRMQTKVLHQPKKH